MTPELAAMAARLDQVERAALPGLAGEAAALHARILARLMEPTSTVAWPEPTSEPDQLLTAEQAAERLGVKKRWMYRHAETLPFTRRLSGGTLRFSARGLERWKANR